MCFRDIRLGVVADLVLDAEARRVVGFDVVCGDRVHRFLALAACDVGADAARVGSALVLMAQELEFYRRVGRALTALRGSPVRREGRPLGALADLVLGQAGDVVAFVVETEDGVRRVPRSDLLSLGHDPLRPAV